MSCAAYVASRCRCARCRPRPRRRATGAGTASTRALVAAVTARTTAGVVRRTGTSATSVRSGASWTKYASEKTRSSPAAVCAASSNSWSRAAEPCGKP